MVARRVWHHSKADEEVQNVHAWYFGIRVSLGEEFLRLYYESIARISEMPLSFPKHIKRTRRCNMVKFPYKIIFRERRSGIQIVALSHVAQEPGYWKRRIR